MSGHVYKRWTCPVQRDEVGRRLNCQRPHGSWTMVADVAVAADGRRRQRALGKLTPIEFELAFTTQAAIAA